jgi:hypothetical protein
MPETHVTLFMLHRDVRNARHRALTARSDELDRLPQERRSDPRRTGFIASRVPTKTPAEPKCQFVRGDTGVPSAGI